MGQAQVERHVRTLDGGGRQAVDGRGWTVEVDGGRWTVREGRWTVEGGLWTVDG